jgi:hypothetical protein
MYEWEVSVQNTITVVTDANVNLSAFFTPSSESSYTQMPGSFTKNGSRHFISYTFNTIGKYTVRVVDMNGNMKEQFLSIDVKSYEDIHHTSLDSYANKDDWKGLNNSQNATLIDTNDKISEVQTTLGNVKSTVDTLPTLLDIEASTILAKKADVSVVEAICNNLPVISDIRDEMINVTFGALEIANNQLTIKDKAGSTIAIFDLFDDNGNPTMTRVFKRTVVS